MASQLTKFQGTFSHINPHKLLARQRSVSNRARRNEAKLVHASKSGSRNDNKMLLLRFGGRRTLVQCSRLPGSSIGSNRLLHTFPFSSTYRRPSLRRVAIPTTTSNIANGPLRPCPGHVALYASESDGKPPRYAQTAHRRCFLKPNGLTPVAHSTASKIAAKLPTLPKNIHEDIRTLPNLLTLSRLVAAPFVGYFILHDQHAWALGLFAYAGVTDLLDGWIARRWKQQTVVGTVIDPMADKMLMTILTVCLAAQGSLPGELCGPSLIAANVSHMKTLDWLGRGTIGEKTPPM